MNGEPPQEPCARWTEAVSAIVDGEEPGIDERLVAAHLARCPACRAFAAAATAQRGRRTVIEIAAMPDLAAPVTRSAALLDRGRHAVLVRAALAAVAVAIVALALPALVLGDAGHADAHAARHLGAFATAYGVGLLVVVARPARARTMLPVAVVVAAALVITAAVDLADRQVRLLGEVQHLPEVASVLLVWLLAVPSRRRDRRGRRAPSEPVLRVVEESSEARRTG